MIDLYNHTKKLYWLKQHHPSFALIEYPAIMELLYLIRPSLATTPVDPVVAFLQTRVFRFSSNSPILPNASVLLPLIDMMNHHPLGAEIEIDQEGLSTGIRAPNGGTECYVQYRDRMDALDLALAHGYADQNTPFARSAPVSVTIESVGKISVSTKFIQPTHPLDPPGLKFGPDETSLSHLVCDRRNPQQFHVVLKLAISALARRRGLSASQTDRAYAQVVDALFRANMNLLDKLKQTIGSLSDPIPAAVILLRATAVQAANLRDVMLGYQTDG
jgi:hypothetical protein